MGFDGKIGVTDHLYILKHKTNFSDNDELKELISVFDKKIKNHDGISTVSDLIEFAITKVISKVGTTLLDMMTKQYYYLMCMTGSVHLLCSSRTSVMMSIYQQWSPQPIFLAT